MDRAPQLRVIPGQALGYDNVDVDAGHGEGICVINTRRPHRAHGGAGIQPLS